MNNLIPNYNHTWIDQIPTIWMDVKQPTKLKKLVIWLPWFSGNKESMISYLTFLSERGFIALSFDPWQHGERATEPTDALTTRVLGNFRRHMWPILAHSTFDTLRVMDWAVEVLNVEPQVFVGGISMGGDISVAAASIDKRIKCVAALNATPDWMRPGTDTKPGKADSYSEYLFHNLNPMSHLDAYSHCPAILFECGADDKHVPPDGALRFQKALSKTYELCPEKLRVNLHAGIAHQSTDKMWQNSLNWFANHS